MPKKRTPKKPWDSDPRPGEREVGKNRIDRITKEPTFEPDAKPIRGTRYHRWRKTGESIVGEIVGDAIANVRRQSSWPILLDSGEVVEVFGNKTLHSQLRPCIGEKVRIVWIGKKTTSWGHWKRIYRVYKIDARGIETIA